tara:strand:- start:191 stop:3100 length:2910 start_codon:yes stop_codon:yes gene_type:complete
MKKYVLIIFSVLFSMSNHPELIWETIETEHFYIHFHKETERSAREASIVAEHVYGPITSLYQFEPDSKTHIIIKDTDDISNGAAYFYDNKIEIWAMPLDFDLRGSHRWIQNVITHEFTHIIQVQASMKFGRTFPAAYLQWIDYEQEKREDVLYGYPNVIVSTPISGVIVPPWLAEGTAQYMYHNANFDYWDSHRDMILRDKVYNNSLLSFNDMNTFGKRGIGNECTYNQGFSFVKYLVEIYGEKILKDISQSLSKPVNYSIYKVLKDITGQSAIELYNDWKMFLEEEYLDLKEEILDNKIEGKILESSGTTNIHPVWSPNEENFAFISNKDNDYFSQTDLFVYNFSDSISKKIAGSVHYAPFWESDTIIYYSKKSKPNKFGSKYFDIYRYNLNTEKEHRLTEDQRTISPIIVPDTKKIYAIQTYDGTSNIVFSSLDTIVFSPLTNYKNGIQIFSLSYDADEQVLWYDGVENHTRNLYSLNLNTNNIEFQQVSYDNREPTIFNKKIAYSSDKTGIYNIFIDDKPITNVLGGAFMPHFSKNGNLLYSLYDDGKYKVALIKSTDYTNDIANLKLAVNNSVNHLNSILFNDGEIKNSRPYEEYMPSPFIFPRLMFDYGTIKPGFYFYSGEILNKLSVIGGASINNQLDTDLLLSFEYRKLKPTIYINIFGITRNKKNLDVPLDGYGDTKVKADLRFSLFETDIGINFKMLQQKIWIEYIYQKFRQRQTQNISSIQQEANVDGNIGFDYFRGHLIKLKGLFSTRKPEFAGNMLPSNGYQIHYEFSYEYNQFMSDLDFDSGIIITEFNLNNTFRFILETQKNITINQEQKIVASINSKIGLISNKEIDDFFHFFGGGMPGIKGYTFYDSTLTGSSLWINTASVRFPLMLEKNIKVFHLNIQNISLGNIFQFGGGFDGNIDSWISNQAYKMSSGIELRLRGYSFYAYPMAISFEYHLPINDKNESSKSYFSILFDF